MKYFIFIILLLSSPQAWGLELLGYPTQGGFLIGKTVPNAQVTLGENVTTADKNGQFVLGIQRLESEKAHLKIMLMEGIEETHPLTIGQNTYKTQYIKGVKKKHVTPRDPKDLAQIKQDKAAIYSARDVFETLPYIKSSFALPVSGTITGVYGSRRFYNGEERNWHKGVDFAAPTGTAIKAPTSGVVRLALANSFFNGNLVIVDHGYQLMTIYAHLNSISVQAGQKVKQGDVLGTLGSTGRSTGPHLHWGLYWRNMALNPMLLLTKKENIK